MQPPAEALYTLQQVFYSILVVSTYSQLTNNPRALGDLVYSTKCRIDFQHSPSRRYFPKMKSHYQIGKLPLGWTIQKQYDKVSPKYFHLPMSVECTQHQPLTEHLACRDEVIPNIDDDDDDESPKCCRCIQHQLPAEHQASYMGYSPNFSNIILSLSNIQSGNITH